MIVIPQQLIDSHEDESPEWLAALPTQLDEYLTRWDLTRTDDFQNGAASLTVPVVRRDGTAAMLKLQPRNDESESEALALRTWSPDDVVTVLEDDPATAALLLERLRPATLNDVPDHVEATRILAELMARLIVVPAPPEVRTLEDIATEMVEEAADLKLDDPADQRLADRYAAQLRELIPESGDRLLHWDLHYGNVLAADRQPWLVIDPKPLAGDPAFELFQVLHNRWDDLVATGNLEQAIRDRFDLMLDVTAIDRDRAHAWTAARVLQNILWEEELDPTYRTIALALRL
ncbi:hydroxyurea phosphotransferase [Kribbella antibiotica]|uniref:Hydroxyurea phosphotransferase n=1 Tax=Kribbella antibiotica TaxID=190195 RepID=A0A4V2YPA3_9ACTN|nr:aminoglycoside phosphotransferase family protein [Kribbella antibiotica]TDD57527.1 hydroxyurea phosphotransferase [Kribbella antibiotica]